MDSWTDEELKQRFLYIRGEYLKKAEQAGPLLQKLHNLESELKSLVTIMFDRNISISEELEDEREG